MIRVRQSRCKYVAVSTLCRFLTIQCKLDRRCREPFVEEEPGKSPCEGPGGASRGEGGGRGWKGKVKVCIERHIAVSHMKLDIF